MFFPDPSQARGFVAGDFRQGFQAGDLRQALLDHVQVAGFFVATGEGITGLSPLSAQAQRPPTPADQGIPATAGDDTSAPNATTVERLNRVVCVASANVGYSSAAQDTNVPPSAIEYDAQVLESPRGHSLSLRITLTYKSSFAKEGMVVWLKKRQQMINDEGLSELLLIETAFEDFVHDKWVPITTDVRYAEEAEAIVQAVITSDVGQTAGRVQTKGAVEDAKLGPVGEQGRIVLTYLCEQLYSYAQMSLPGEEGTGARSLVPLLFNLPWAPCDSPAAQCSVAVRVRGPEGSCLLEPQRNVMAYSDLKQSFLQQQLHTAVVIPASQGSDSWAFGKETLPPMSTAVLAWLSIPDALDESWEDLSQALPASQGPRVTLLKPAPEEEGFLKVSLPGGQVGQLLRCRLETAPPKRSPQVVRVHTDLTISDASGSTGMGLKGGFGGAGPNVRSGFNAVEARRVISRLQAVPMLRAQGLLLPEDLWRQHFVVFDSGVRAEFELETRVAELEDETVASLLKALDVGDAARQEEGAKALRAAGREGLLQAWRGLLERLHAVKPGGTTSFVAGANRAREAYCSKRNAGAGLFGKAVERTCYVNFDTDGGNNCGPCYDAIRELVKQADVVQGHVLGVGAWVDQDCASKVAKLLKGSASLALSFPEQAASDALLRQDISRWIKVLRSCPVNVTVSAGVEHWVARHGARSENAVDCLAAAGNDGLRFEAPDVSDVTFTKAKLAGMQAGESGLLYLLSRLPLPVLQQRLAVALTGSGESASAVVAVAADPLQGALLGHHWLQMLAATPGFSLNASSLCTRLRQRLEDDLSFAWNLPSKSGSTAAMGRASTQQRPPVPPEKQPAEPRLPEARKADKGSLFGKSGGVVAGHSSFGGSSFGAPPQGATFGAGPGFLALGKGSSPPGDCSRGGAGSGVFGAASSLAKPAASSLTSLFTTKQQKCMAPPAPARCPMGGPADSNPMRKRVAKKPQSAWDEEEAPPSSRVLTPKELLAGSNQMRMGPSESPEAEIHRSMAAVRYMASTMASGPTSAKPEQEDPLVSTLFGQAPQESVLQPTHAGYTCDGCGQDRITGVRFKACSKADVDVCLPCRVNGRLAGACGFKPMADLASALQEALLAMLEWWPLAWASKGASPPALALLGYDLSTPAQVRGLALLNLRQVVQMLPNP